MPATRSRPVAVPPATSPDLHEPPVRHGIDKVAWVRVEGGRVLCARSRGKETFYLPGGKRDPGESDLECLCREIAEELGVTLRRETVRALDLVEAPAHGQPAGTIVRTACYAADYDGRLAACAEIEEFAWLAHDDRTRGSETLRIVLDRLHARGEIL